MVKHIQIIRQQQQKNCLSVFDHFAGLALEGLILARYHCTTLSPVEYFIAPIQNYLVTTHRRIIEINARFFIYLFVSAFKQA